MAWKSFESLFFLRKGKEKKKGSCALSISVNSSSHFYPPPPIRLLREFPAAEGKRSLVRIQPDLIFFFVLSFSLSRVEKGGEKVEGGVLTNVGQ